jgi:hypothetical protein
LDGLPSACKEIPVTEKVVTVYTYQISAANITLLPPLLRAHTVNRVLPWRLSYQVAWRNRTHDHEPPWSAPTELHNLSFSPILRDTTSCKMQKTVHCRRCTIRAPNVNKPPRKTRQARVIII